MTTTGLWKIGFPLAAAIAVQWGIAMAAESRFEIDLKELPKAAAPPAKHAQTPASTKRPALSPGKGRPADGAPHHYTVKPGDHIFRILMRDFGLSNQQAEQLIPDIARLNGISDIRRLRVGQELLIPLTPSSRHTRKAEEKPATRTETASRPAPKVTSPAEERVPPVADAPSPVAEPEPVQPATAEQQVPPEPEPRSATATAPPQSPPPPPSPSPATGERVVITPVTVRERDGAVDAVLDLMAPGWTRNRIVEGGKQSTDGSYVSIKVDRYFEYRGNRYIVNSENDPLTLTLLRILEVQGDRVINIGRDAGASAIAGQLAAKMDLPRQEGNFRFKCLDQPGSEAEVHGVRITPAGPFGRQLLITGDQVPACTAELLVGAEATQPAR